jgi:peptidoglycan/LPS O-acetylase OafA/YrhL
MPPLTPALHVRPIDRDREPGHHSVPALDGLRGVAILGVLAHQLCIDGYEGSRAVSRALLPLQVGWSGVQLFFVLSGFLITGILLDTRGARNYWSSFYARRALRIFPLYYLLLLSTFVIAPRLFTLSSVLLAEYRYQGWYWTYLVNVAPLFHAGTVGPLGHCWSLSVEEQFYWLWPFAVRFLHERALVRLCIGVAAFALVFRLGLRIAHVSPEMVYELTPARLDALALGALGAVAVRQRSWLAWIAPRLGRATAGAATLLAATAIASGGLARENAITQTIGYSAVAVVSVLVILRSTLDTIRGHGWLAALLSSPILRTYGRYSYAIYVLHLPLHLIVTRTLFAARLATLPPTTFLGLQAAYLVIGALGLLLLGALSYRIVEKPFLELKRFFVATRSPSLPS